LLSDEQQISDETANSKIELFDNSIDNEGQKETTIAMTTPQVREAEETIKPMAENGDKSFISEKISDPKTQNFGEQQTQSSTNVLIAKQGPPKRKATVDGQAAPPIRPATASQKNKIDPEKETYIMITEQDVIPNGITSTASSLGDYAKNLLDNNNNKFGGLVKKILETNEQLTSESVNLMELHATTSIAKEKMQTKKHVESIKENIQRLCMNVAPLGRTLDFFQEDLDSMAKEFNFWKETAKNHNLKLEQLKSDDDKFKDPSEGRISRLDEEIKAYKKKIDEAKIKITDNEEKIMGLMKNIIVGRQ
jgi:TRAF3-interacting protein 1